MKPAERKTEACDGKGVAGLISECRIAERGDGARLPLALLKWVMVLIFVSFGIQKFTPQSAQGIAVYISNSQFVSWLQIFGIRGEACLLVLGAFTPVVSMISALLAAGMFAVT